MLWGYAKYCELYLTGYQLIICFFSQLQSGSAIHYNYYLVLHVNIVQVVYKNNQYLLSGGLGKFFSAAAHHMTKYNMPGLRLQCPQAIGSTSVQPSLSSFPLCDENAELIQSFFEFFEFWALVSNCEPKIFFRKVVQSG